MLPLGWMQSSKQKPVLLLHAEPIRTETLKARSTWTDVLQILENMDANSDYYTQKNLQSVDGENKKDIDYDH
ncbi:hypothetical protein STEG23_021796 [Scotinomys teguina]